MSPAGVSGGAGGGAEARGGGAEEEPVSHVRTVGRVAAVGSRAFEGREAWCGNGRCFYGMGVGRGQTGRRRRRRRRGGGIEDEAVGFLIRLNCLVDTVKRCLLL